MRLTTPAPFGTLPLAAFQKRTTTAPFQLTERRSAPALERWGSSRVSDFRRMENRKTGNGEFTTGQWSAWAIGPFPVLHSRFPVFHCCQQAREAKQVVRCAPKSDVPFHAPRWPAVVGSIVHARCVRQRRHARSS